MTRDDETIVAAATPPGRSALAIVRIDGPESRAIIADLAGRAFEERRATLVQLRDGEDLLDEAVVTSFVGPRSFTGNDLVEISLHGSPALVERLIVAVTRRGGRLAEPGEFTERAVLNGKLDLVQAEAVGELIASRTSLQSRLALGHLGGDLSRLGESIRSELLGLIARLEAALDFADEGYNFVSEEETRGILESALASLDRLAATWQRGRAVREGLELVLLGRPNAGKSTLLNALVGSDRAIVTPIAGTTRDLLRETIEIGGVPVTVVDTAGLREGGDLVEGIGIERARAAASSADLILYLVDATDPEEPPPSGLFGTAPVIPVWTKSDLASVPEGVVALATPAGKGVDELLALLDRIVRETWVPPEGTPALTSERQKRHVSEAREAIAAALAQVGSVSEEMLLVDVWRGANALGAITGAIGHGDVIGEIFAKFCIGK